jgi:hypothetical protein
MTVLSVCLQVGMTVLSDNEPKHKYVYLICVVTGWWPKAGTTANVFIYLRAKYKQSARHNLGDKDRKLFTSGAENWFVLTTPKKLGRMQSIMIWHDNKGRDPSWYVDYFTHQLLGESNTLQYIQAVTVSSVIFQSH